MKNTLRALCLLMAFSLPVLAGDIPHPKPVDPPPCTENCMMAEDTSSEEPTPIEAAAIVIRGFMWAVGDTLNLY